MQRDVASVLMVYNVVDAIHTIDMLKVSHTNDIHKKLSQIYEDITITLFGKSN